MKRTAATLLLLLAGVAGAADYATATKHDEQLALSPLRAPSSRKVQWAPTGNFSALHARAVFEEESGEAARPYAGERREVAAGSRIFLSRDSVGASSYLASPNGLGVWAYANLNPSRFTDPDGRWGDDGSQFPYGDEASIENRCRQGDPEACEATKAALVAQGFAVCMALPGCRETMIVAGKAGGGAYAIAWLTGLRGHNEEGGHVERIPDPVTAVGSGVYGSGKECVDKPGLNMSCASFGMVVVPTAGAGANAFAKALARTQLARALTFSAYLELAPLELQAPEVAAMRVFQSGAPQMSRVAPPAALPTSQGAFSPWSSFVAPQPTMSWANAASAARRNSFAAGGGTAARVGVLREAIPAASRGRITMGVGVAEDASGARQVLVGTSEPRGYLRPGVTLVPGETIAPGLGHAEADIVNYAQQNGLRLLEVGATRPICPACAAAIEGAGARAVTPLKVP